MLFHSKVFLELAILFVEDEWSHCESTSFDEYCNFLTEFNSDEQALLVDLSERFYLTDYQKRRILLKDVMQKACKYAKSKSRKAFISPLSQGKDDCCGSSQSMYYQLRCLFDENNLKMTLVSSLYGDHKSRY